MMEFFQELLFTVCISLISAFLLAKLITLASPSSLHHEVAEDLISTVDLSQYPVTGRATGVRELKLEEVPQKRGSEEAEVELKSDGRDDGIVGEIDGNPMKGEVEIVKDWGKEGLDEGEGVELEEKSGRIVVREGFGEGKGVGVVEMLEEEVNAGDGDVKELKEEEKRGKDGEFDVGLVKEEAELNKDGFGIVQAHDLNLKAVEEEQKYQEHGEFDSGLVKEETKSSQGHIELKEANEGMKSQKDGEFDVGLVEEEAKSNKDGSGLVNFAKEGKQEVGVAEIGVEKGSFLNDEEEWEGIERSELEKRFGALASMVASGSGDVLERIGSEVQMQLYGLHKVATEGPCHRPQPSVLKVSARAKWHAWQQLGNMNPEVAMEQYINLLSDSIPGWTAESPEDEKKQVGANDSLEEPGCGSNDPDLNSTMHQSSGNKRKMEEVHPCMTKDDAIGGPDFTEPGHSMKNAA
ncbi:acyl-CoA-binding domain-containing protein 3-like protein [Cinnamomum micranthum f. kanehirae]|uniref:Acyl-CoA-binding domain-containing protein 3-like protein n=1 Tax=Cinnamomum micranthum f. kanehirae TaxID=337451 RepID=A0A443NL01_9MAGN|nr:acyl-CoA-binding domain-containing protein 3-like protein [Cinnamomum micranthum f. kanehirae]